MASFGSFVIKERVEDLENRVNTILDEDKLRKFAQETAREEAGAVVSNVVHEIEAKRDEVLGTIKAGKNEFFEEFDVTISCICRELRNLQLVAGFAFALSVLATILSCFL
jgi:hypothetical protein